MNKRVRKQKSHLGSRGVKSLRTKVRRTTGKTLERKTLGCPSDCICKRGFQQQPLDDMPF